MQEATKNQHNAQHPYAEILHAIAEGKQIQYLESSQNEWFGIPRESVLLELTRQHCRHQFRIKPEVILINGIEVPKPCSKAPKLGEYFFIVNVGNNTPYEVDTWSGHITDYELLKRGIIHQTKEAAIKHAEALLSFTQVNATVQQ